MTTPSDRAGRGIEPRPARPRRSAAVTALPGLVAAALLVGCSAEADITRLASSPRELAPSAASAAPSLDFATGKDLPSAIYDPTAHEDFDAVPVAIRIDSLGISAATVLPVGLEDNGEMQVPPADQVGWYRLAASPETGRGSTVLAAHVAYNGVDGVFRRLDRTRVGETVEVVLDDDTTVRYRVESVETINKQSLPQDFFRVDGPAQLVLITCGGAFDNDRRSYESNVVVRAVPL